MGDVYLAEDTSLGRRVALKVLPTELASDERRARFTREAQALAALSHPNIVTVHSVEFDSGVHFITMELVQGRTLTELLPREGLALERFLVLAIPLADAVAGAHQQGIVHRDLKPGNVMVDLDGRVKVLDFGLAKPIGGLAADSAASDVPTAIMTEPGLIVGTWSYMSPEQARGQPVDARSDIFALGIIFYEMLTGRRPFTGDTPTELLSSIIRDVPPAASSIRSGIPRDLSRIVHRCLAKDPARRMQSALDIRNELEELKREIDSGELLADVQPAATRRRAASRVWWGGAAVVVILGLLGIFGSMRTEPSNAPAIQLRNPRQVTFTAGVETGNPVANVWRVPILEHREATWEDAEQLTFDQALIGSLDLFPDGERLLVSSDRGGYPDLWTVQVKGGEMRQLTADRAPDTAARVSPDGRHIVFYSQRRSRHLGHAFRGRAPGSADPASRRRHGSLVVSGRSADRVLF